MPLIAPRRVFLTNRGISDKDALLHFRLAPLSTKRDITMLGLIHRAPIGKGPPQLRTSFTPARNRISLRRHRFGLEGVLEGNYLEIARRSCLGFVRVYNSLPGEMVDDVCNVSTFQSQLQRHIVEHAKERVHNWASLFTWPIKQTVW